MENYTLDKFADQCGSTYYPSKEEFFSREDSPDVIRVMEAEFDQESVGTLYNPEDDEMEKLMQEIGASQPLTRKERIHYLKKRLNRPKNIRKDGICLDETIDLREALLKDYQEVEESSEKLERLSDEIENLTAARKDLEIEFREAAVDVYDLAALLEAPNQKELIIGKYVHFFSWGQIADKLEMSVRSAQKLHGIALLALDAKLYGTQCGDKENAADNTV